MPGDLRPRWDVATAIACARALEPLGVEWLEEPLRTDDVDGYAALRRATSLRIAAGEMVRDAAQARDLVVRGGVDVIQPDVVLAGGIGGARRIAAVADLHGRTWSPHTWSNGYGLVANLHAALAFSTCPYVEVPYDPPAWPAAQRATGCCRRPSRSRPTGRSGRRTVPASASSPTSTPSTGTGWDERGRRRDPGRRPRRGRACRSASRHSLLDPPRHDEVLVRVAAAGVCHSDLHLAQGHLGDGRWPTVLGHEGAGVVEAVGESVSHVVPATGSPSASSRRAASAACASPGGGTCASRPPSVPSPARDGRHLAATAVRRHDDQALPDRVLLRRALRVPAAGAVPIGRHCRCGRRPWWDAASSPAWAPCATRPGSRRARPCALSGAAASACRSSPAHAWPEPAGSSRSPRPRQAGARP